MHEVVILTAKYAIIIPVIIAAYIGWKQWSTDRFFFFSLLVGAGILSLLLAKIGSHLFYDTRPFVAGHFQPYFSHGSDNGFPSDHTLLGGLLAFVSWHFDKRLGGLAFVIALLIGLARVIAGVHHLLDIVGSLVITAVSVLIVNFVTEKYLASRPPDS